MADFSRIEASSSLQTAMLPVEYEKALLAGKTPEEAQKVVHDRVPSYVETSILRHRNSTAVVTYDRLNHTVGVAFDASDEGMDKLDDMTFWSRQHDLGGEVHSGFWNAATRENADGRILIDSIKDKVKEYAGKSNGVVDLNMSGFSKGGAAAIIAAGQWMAEKFPDEDADNIRLASVYTFGSPPSGNQEFINKFEQNAQAQGVNIWRVVAGNDSIPTMMATDAPWYMPAMYAHIGNTAHLDIDGNSTINPAKEDVLDIRRASSLVTGWHDPNLYGDLLKKGQVDGLSPQTNLAVLSRRLPEFAP